MLKCELCGADFTCKHEMVNNVSGAKVRVPHCKKCFWDDGKCPDRHGYQCPKCQNFAPEFNP